MMSGRRSISEYYRELLESIKGVIYQNDTLVNGKDTDQVLKELLSRSAILQPIEFDSSRSPSLNQRKETRTVPAAQRDFGYRDEGDLRCEFEVISIAIPIIHNTSIKHMRSLRPAAFTIAWLHEEFEWSEREVSFSFDVKGYRFELGDDQITREVEKKRRQLREWVEEANQDIRKEVEGLSASLFTIIEERRRRFREMEIASENWRKS